MPSLKEAKRQARKARIRRKVNGTPERPRLTVFRSNTEIYVQVIDDSTGQTLVAASSIDNGLKPQVQEIRANPPKPPAEEKEEAKADDGGGKKGKKKGGDKKPKKPQTPVTVNRLIAEKVGQTIAERCKEKSIEKVVFDRGGYRYHGRVKSLADAARKAGLVF